MKRLISTLIPFAAAALSASAAPFVAVDFTQVEDGVASSAQRDFLIHMEDGAKVLPGGPTGTPYVEFDGTAAPRVDARQVERKLAGDEMAAGLWFRADALADGPIAFEKAGAMPGVTPSFKKWCGAMAASASSFGDAGNVRDWMDLQKLRWMLPELSRLATGVKAQSLVDAPLLPIAIYPYHWLKRLPFRMPEDGEACNGLEIRATLGEIEGASFMAFPFESGKLFAEPSALAGPGGAKLPASVLDVRTVKFWHSHAGGWNSYFGGGKEFPVLTGECLLHDDALLRVDREKHRNYLRISDPDGDRYVDISVSGTPENMEHLKTDVEPVRDAKAF